MFLNNIIKVFILSLLITLTFIEGYSQDLHYSNNYENSFNLNPSSITDIKTAAIYINYRDQWPGTADFINYSGAFFNTFTNLKSTIGVQIIRDSQGKGIINNTGFSILYGYKTKIANNIFFSSGLAGSYNIYSYDISKLTFENNQIPAALENYKNKYVDFSAGLEFSLYNNYLGAAIGHITSPSISTANRLARKITINYRGVYHLTKHYSARKIMLEPLLLTSIQSINSEIIYGSRINIDGIQGGLYLRNDYQMNFDSFIILLGISFGKITVNYTYDINLSGSQSRFNKLASHEVTFFYNLEYNIRRNKKGAIKCPKF